MQIEWPGLDLAKRLKKKKKKKEITMVLIANIKLVLIYQMTDYYNPNTKTAHPALPLNVDVFALCSMLMIVPKKSNQKLNFDKSEKPTIDIV